MNQSLSAQNQNNNRQGFPLAFVFIVVAFAATIIGICGPGISALVSGDANAGGFMVTSCVSCAVIGKLVGLYHYRRWIGGFVGLLTGATLGPLLGATAATDDFDRLFIACIVGSAMIVFIGFAYSVIKNGKPM